MDDVLPRLTTKLTPQNGGKKGTAWKDRPEAKH
jgi:hypothetical protein